VFNEIGGVKDSLTEGKYQTNLGDYWRAFGCAINGFFGRENEAVLRDEICLSGTILPVRQSASG
jgi:hypothetical protein